MKKALIGYGGHAREVMSQMGEILPCYVDDEYVDNNTLPLSTIDPTEYEFMVAIGDSKLRYDMVKKLPNNIKYFTFIHATAQLMDNNITIGNGSFIGANSIITCNVKIGEHAILNRGNHIGHDSVIGNYFSAMPGAIISGNCIIGDLVYIGTNSSVKEKIRINSFITIGLNAGVIKNIDLPGTYVGTPAKKIN